MALHFDLDSAFRDRFSYPNAADYQIGGDEIASWFLGSKQMNIMGGVPFRVRVSHVTLPYSPTVDVEPQLYLQFSTTNGVNKLLTIDGKHAAAQFVLIPSHPQRDTQTGAPLWLHYQSMTDQDLVLSRGTYYVVRITRRDGSVLTEYIEPASSLPLPPDMSRQTIVALSANCLTG